MNGEPAIITCPWAGCGALPRSSSAREARPMRRPVLGTAAVGGVGVVVMVPARFMLCTLGLSLCKGARKE